MSCPRRGTRRVEGGRGCRRGNIRSRHAGTMRRNWAALALGPPHGPPPRRWGGAADARRHPSTRGGGQAFVDFAERRLVATWSLAAQENYRFGGAFGSAIRTTRMGHRPSVNQHTMRWVLMVEFYRREPPRWVPRNSGLPFAPVHWDCSRRRVVLCSSAVLKNSIAQCVHKARGALFEAIRQLGAASAYPKPGETLEAAAQREAGTVRKAAACSTARRWVSSRSGSGRRAVSGSHVCGTMSNLNPVRPAMDCCSMKMDRRRRLNRALPGSELYWVNPPRRVEQDGGGIRNGCNSNTQYACW